MSGGATAAAWVGVGIAAAGAAVSAYQNDRKMHQQKIANQKAEARAKETAERSAQETRRQNGREADISSLLEQNSNQGLSGGSTLLNGAQGVDKSKLNLGGGSTLG